METPKSNMYPTPRDLPAHQLHYIVVQVSDRRHVVAEYFSGTGVPEFVAVTKPMPFAHAVALAQQFARDRFENAARGGGVSGG
jgi:hypothetical protein